MTNEQLQAWVEEISLRFFGRPFKHRATFNRRLSSTGGRYFLNTHHIDIAWKQFEYYGKEEVEKIIKHELCHYHLHLMNRGYRHRDPEFKTLLKQVGGRRYCQALPVTYRRKEPYRYLIHCTACQAMYRRKRRMDTRKYVCGKCQGKLNIMEISTLNK